MGYKYRFKMRLQRNKFEVTILESAVYESGNARTNLWYVYLTYIVWIIVQKLSVATTNMKKQQSVRITVVSCDFDVAEEIRLKGQMTTNNIFFNKLSYIKKEKKCKILH